jgi:hypothetical protein
MATLLKVLNNLADIKSAGGVAPRVRTQAEPLQVYLPNRAKRNSLRVTATYSMINCGIGDFG